MNVNFKNGMGNGPYLYSYEKILLMSLHRRNYHKEIFFLGLQLDYFKMKSIQVAGNILEIMSYDLAPVPQYTTRGFVFLE